MTAAPTIKPILKYPGGKWRNAAWVVSHFPPHTKYLEPFVGSAAIYLHKTPAEYEVINDLSGDVVNFLRVIREHSEALAGLIALTPWAREEYDLSYEVVDDPVERARRFVVRVWQAQNGDLSKHVGWANRGFHGTASTVGRWRKLPDRILAIADRLLQAEIENTDAVELINRANNADTLIYADPPYVLETRSSTLYQYEMTPAQHLALLEALDNHAGPVVLSGYRCALYDDRLSHWHTVERKAQAEKGNTRTEVLWLNDKARPMQRGLFEVAP